MQIYIAGPAVFQPDAAAIGGKLKAIAGRYGLVAMFPLDGEASDRRLRSIDIFQANRGMIDRADVVVADLNPFRGAEPDSGTVWEIGYAAGQGKRVVGHIASDEPMAMRVARMEAAPAAAELLVDSMGRAIEPYGYPLNLMLMHGVDLVVGSFEDACRMLAQKNIHKIGATLCG